MSTPLLEDLVHDVAFEGILKRAIAAHRRTSNVFATDEHPMAHYAEQERQAMLAAMKSAVNDLIELGFSAADRGPTR